MNTNCSKCNAEMRTDKPIKSGIFARMPALITGYRCSKCGHWNNLKRRKGYAEYKSKAMGEV
jgi:DNA-directed RNA polymerase subunit RPC12/RpoP